MSEINLIDLAQGGGPAHRKPWPSPRRGRGDGGFAMPAAIARAFLRRLPPLWSCAREFHAWRPDLSRQSLPLPAAVATTPANTAPPHEFGINVPQGSSPRCATRVMPSTPGPAPLAAAFQRNGLVMALGMAAGVCGCFFLLALSLQRHSVLFRRPIDGAGSRILRRGAVWGHGLGRDGPPSSSPILAMAMGFRRFLAHHWRPGGGAGRRAGRCFRRCGTRPRCATWAEADMGCNDQDGRFSTTRRKFPSRDGRMASCSASPPHRPQTLYDHVLAWPAPYPFFSIPVLLGGVGWDRPRGQERWGCCG